MPGDESVEVDAAFQDIAVADPGGQGFGGQPQRGVGVGVIGLSQGHGVFHGVAHLALEPIIERDAHEVGGDDAEQQGGQKRQGDKRQGEFGPKPRPEHAPAPFHEQSQAVAQHHGQREQQDDEIEIEQDQERHRIRAQKFELDEAEGDDAGEGRQAEQQVAFAFGRPGRLGIGWLFRHARGQ